MKKPKLGTGKRFAKLEKNVAHEYMEKGTSKKKAMMIGGAVAAKVGVKKYGQAKMTKMAVAGKKRK